MLVSALLVSSAFAQKKISTDIVVVGAGGSGLAAAVEALEGGARVVLLEKAPSLGGNAQFVEGMAAIDNEMARRDNVLFTPDMAYQRIMEYGHWKNNAALVRRFTLESGKDIQWLQQRGTKFERVATPFRAILIGSGTRTVIEVMVLTT